MKVLFRRLHLYMGLAAGLVIMVTCFTGAVLVFEEELQHAFSHDRYFVKHSGDRLPLAQLVNSLEAKVPNISINAVRVYADPHRSVELVFAKKEKEKSAQAAGPQKESKPNPGNNSRAFIDPYTGTVLDVFKQNETFYYKMEFLHRWLLAGDVGKLIVGISTLIFTFIIITGIIIWWPKNTKMLKQRLTLKRGASWKRVNHDLHVVLASYSSIFLFVFAFTGLAWAFKWFNNGIYYVTSSPLKNPEPPKSAVDTNGSKKPAIDQYLAIGVAHFPHAVYYNINLPKKKDDAVAITVLNPTAAYETATDQLFLDRYSYRLLDERLFVNRSTGAKVRATFKPVHTGSIFGLPSKIIAIIVCLLGTTFPVTGFIMWINRTRKKSKVAVKQYEVEMGDAEPDT